MTRDEAVARIQEDLGFLTGQSTIIISRLKEAQRDLERGKTLPKFLLQELQALNLVAGTRLVALPSQFIRPDDDNFLHYAIPGQDEPVYIPWERDFNTAYSLFNSSTSGTPPVAVLLNSVIDFIVTADKNYTIGWSYYKGAALLDTNIENEWLNEVTGAPEWLIGEAGHRMAKTKRDKEAIAVFDDMRQRARAACFGEILAREDSTGPIYLGSNL